MQRLVAAVLTAMLILSAGPAWADDTAPSLSSYKLDNGLQVVLVEDHKVPKVAVTVSYRVGVVNEPAGRSGFAHLFEHLMFSGTEAYPEIDAPYIAQGIIYSGYTDEDATVYYATGIASTLPVILSVQADQMANIGAAVDQVDLDLQRAVVLNEMRQNILDAPGGSAYEALKSGLYPRPHPYSRATIGSIADLNAATLSDVKTFFNAYYVPNNAVLALVGDFDSAAAMAMIEDTFGRIPRGVDVVVPAIAEAPPTRLRIEAEDAVTTPVVYMGFAGPAGFGADDAALGIAGDLLGNEFGLLQKALVNSRIASYAGAFWQPGRLGGRFFVLAVASAGVSADALEAALREAVETFRATPIDAEDFERSRSAFLQVSRTALEAYQTRSEYIAFTVAAGGDASGLLEDDPDLVAVTPGDTAAAITRFLRLEDASVAIVRPGSRGTYPALLSEPSGVPEPLLVAERPPVAIPQLAAGEPQTVALPERQDAMLSNGIKIIHYEMPGAPLHYLTAIVAGGGNNDPPGREGLYNLAVGIAGRGAGSRDFAALGRAARDIGASIGTWAGGLKSGVTLSVPPEAFGAGVDLLADMVQGPRFEPEEWEILRAQILDGLVQREADPQGVAFRALDEVLFTPGPDDSDTSMSIESVEAITLEEASATFQRLFVPATMTIYSVGALRLDEIKPAIEARFGAWQEMGEGIVAKPHLPAVFPAKLQVHVRAMPAATQAMIVVARPAPGLDDPTVASAYVVGRLLGGDFSSRLNMILREEKGYSYGVSAGLLGEQRHNGALVASAPVQVDATGAAFQEMLWGFESLIKVPVTADEMAGAAITQRVVLASLPETAMSLFGALVGAEGEGISLAERLGFFDRVAKLTLGEVQAEARALASLDQAVVVIVGDPTLIVPQLEAMGYDVEVDDGK